MIVELSDHPFCEKNGIFRIKKMKKGALSVGLEALCKRKM